MYKMFAIANCDTVKKARQFLEQHKITYEFIDFKKYTPTDNDIKRWEKAFGSLPVNTKGPTFRKIKNEFEQASHSDKIKIIQSNTSCIKRPILEKNNEQILFGFNEEQYRRYTENEISVLTSN